MNINTRITFIDFIKGIAVIFMMFQHFGIWFWNIPWEKITNIFTDYPVYMAFNATGGFSAPAFIACAGFGAYYFNEKYSSNLKFVKRGLILIVFGYLMNLLVPSWFTWASWYVLHLMGFCLVISPLIFKIRKKYLLFMLIGAIALLSVYVQYMLKTPEHYSSDRMGNYKMAGGIFRLIFAEGHFPVLPWTVFFITGIIAAEYHKNGQRKNILLFAAISLMLSVLILAAGYFVHPNDPSVMRFFRSGTSFYPLYPVMLFFLVSLVLLSIFILSRVNFRSDNAVVLTGRLSLTIFILHVIIFKQGLHLIGKYTYFNAVASFLLMLFFTFLFVLAAKVWSRVNFLFSFEWLMRRLS